MQSQVENKAKKPENERKHSANRGSTQLMKKTSTDLKDKDKESASSSH